LDFPTATFGTRAPAVTAAGAVALALNSALRLRRCIELPTDPTISDRSLHRPHESRSIKCARVADDVVLIVSSI
jgi:hypothetical protein